MTSPLQTIGTLARETQDVQPEYISEYQNYLESHDNDIAASDEDCESSVDGADSSMTSHTSHTVIDVHRTNVKNVSNAAINHKGPQKDATVSRADQSLNDNGGGVSPQKRQHHHKQQQQPQQEQQQQQQLSAGGESASPWKGGSLPRRPSSTGAAMDRRSPWLGSDTGYGDSGRTSGGAGSDSGRADRQTSSRSGNDLNGVRIMKSLGGIVGKIDNKGGQSFKVSAQCNELPAPSSVRNGINAIERQKTTILLDDFPPFQQPPEGPAETLQRASDESERREAARLIGDKVFGSSRKFRNRDVREHPRLSATASVAVCDSSSGRVVAVVQTDDVGFASDDIYEDADPFERAERRQDGSSQTTLDDGSLRGQNAEGMRGKVDAGAKIGSIVYVGSARGKTDARGDLYDERRQGEYYCGHDGRQCSSPGGDDVVTPRQPGNGNTADGPWGEDLWNEAHDFSQQTPVDESTQTLLRLRLDCSSASGQISSENVTEAAQAASGLAGTAELADWLVVDRKVGAKLFLEPCGIIFDEKTEKDGSRSDRSAPERRKATVREFSTQTFGQMSGAPSADVETQTELRLETESQYDDDDASIDIDDVSDKENTMPSADIFDGSHTAALTMEVLKEVREMKRALSEQLSRTSGERSHESRRGNSGGKKELMKILLHEVRTIKRHIDSPKDETEAGPIKERITRTRPRDNQSDSALETSDTERGEDMEETETQRFSRRRLKLLYRDNDGDVTKRNDNVSGADVTYRRPFKDGRRGGYQERVAARSAGRERLPGANYEQNYSSSRSWFPTDTLLSREWSDRPVSWRQQGANPSTAEGSHPRRFPQTMQNRGQDYNQYNHPARPRQVPELIMLKQQQQKMQEELNRLLLNQTVQQQWQQRPPQMLQQQPMQEKWIPSSAGLQPLGYQGAFRPVSQAGMLQATPLVFIPNQHLQHQQHQQQHQQLHLQQQQHMQQQRIQPQQYHMQPQQGLQQVSAYHFGAYKQ